MFEVQGDAILLADPRTDAILDANTAACALFGYTYEELRAVRTVDLIHSNSLDVRPLAARTDGRMVLDARRKDGSAVALEISGFNFTNTGGAFRCVVAREITREERDGRVSRLYTFIDQKLFTGERA